MPKQKTTLPPGFLLVNKPAGWTSFDVVNFIRKKARVETGIKNIKVGHAGTLDPFATGLLIIGVGREATKKLDEFKNLPKTYCATITLGATSDTGDLTGKITETPPYPPLKRGGKISPPFKGEIEEVISEEKIKQILTSFLGKQLQTPPMYSAKKINGKKLYVLARAGKTIERQPNEIEIYNIKLLEYSWPERAKASTGLELAERPKLKIQVSCSAGTYIRTLAEDIGQRLGTGAYCQELERIAIGPYVIEEATPLKVNHQKTDQSWP